MFVPSGSFKRATILAAIVLGGFAIGAFAWSGNIYCLPAVLVLPIALSFTRSRLHTIALVAGYHAGATWPALPGAKLFFGNGLSMVTEGLLWIGIVSVLTLPWALLCSWGKWRLVLGIPAALIVCSFLPTGIADPLTAAGVLFPGTEWFGLLLTIVLFGILPIKPVRGLIATAVISLACHVIFAGAPVQPRNWTGINTDFGGTGFGMPNPMREYTQALTIQQAALNSHASVIVFPETVIYRWNQSTDAYWHQTITTLRKEGKTILVGANESVPDTVGRYRDVIMIRGSETGTYQQHIPLPLAMWRPFWNHGVPLHYGGPSVITVDKTRAAPVICYEELLIYPYLRAMLQHPAVLVGISNEYWSVGTPIASIQSASLHAWAQLFRLPVVSAVNK